MDLNRIIGADMPKQNRDPIKIEETCLWSSFILGFLSTCGNGLANSITLNLISKYIAMKTYNE
jgi:hypothetical protein